MYLTVCPHRGPGSIPSHGIVFQGIFPRLITLPIGLESVWQKMAHFPLNDTTQPVDIEKEG